MGNVSDVSRIENQNTHFVLDNIFFFENRVDNLEKYGKVCSQTQLCQLKCFHSKWKNMVEPGRPQMTIK